jgi:hypothetical protein
MAKLSQPNFGRYTKGLCDPDRPGLLLDPRYWSKESVGIHRILVELPHSSKLELRNPIRPQRIPIELPGSSYEDGFR